MRTWKQPNFTLIGAFCFPYPLGKKKIIQQYQHLSLHLWEDFLPHRFLQLRALNPSYWNLLSVGFFLFLFSLWLNDSTSEDAAWMYGLLCLFLSGMRMAGKGTCTKIVSNLNWKTFKYLKCQICFSISLIWRIHNGSHLISGVYGFVFKTKTSFSSSDGWAICRTSLLLIAG